jgi:hypothetical protein
MTGNGSKLHGRIAPLLAATFLLVALSACGTVDRFRGPQEGAKTELEARSVAQQDPLARPIQVAWTSARASHCAVFNPDQLRSNFMAAARGPAQPRADAKIEHAYDYTLNPSPRRSRTNRLLQQGPHCRNPARPPLLAGDYTPSARMAQ